MNPSFQRRLILCAGAGGEFTAAPLEIASLPPKLAFPRDFHQNTSSVRIGDLWRIGAVSYLNSKPLVEGLGQYAPHAEVSFDLPSRLADRLADGVVDVALVPSVEALRRDDYRVVSNACIGCRGPVWSVKLIGRVPPQKIRTLAVDEGSRSSVALSRVLLWQQYRADAETILLPIADHWLDHEADAVLLIGDRAMDLESDPRAEFAWDLGQQWFELTHLPFVFAMWTIGGVVETSLRAAEVDQLGQILDRARDYGVAAIDEIARREAPRYGLSHQRCRDYLTHNLHFCLGARERAGLGLFHRWALDQKLLPRDAEWVFHDCQTA